jgi:hypothetical protein
MAQWKRGKALVLRRKRRTCGRRWKLGQSLQTVGRAFGKPHNSIRCFLSRPRWDCSAFVGADKQFAKVTDRHALNDALEQPMTARNDA